MEKLFGMWHQTSHVAIIDEMPCDVTPAEEIIWEFTDGLLIQYANNEILSAHSARFYPDHNIITLDSGRLFIVRFTSDGIVLTANNQDKYRVMLTKA